MSDADVIDEVIALVESGVEWTEDGLNEALESTGWCFPGVSYGVVDHEGTVVWPTVCR